MINTYIIVAAVSAAAAFGTAWKVQAWRFDSAKLEAIEDSHEREKMRRQAANAGAQGHEADKTQIRTEFVTITERLESVVKVPVYSQVCIDDAGQQLLKDAARVAGHIEPSSTQQPE